MKTIAAACLALLTAFASMNSAQAQTREDNRQVRQRSRIQAGVATGQITATERASVNAGQRQVQRIENRAQADGVVTNREAARLETAQDVQSRRINRVRTNNRTR